MTKLSNFSKDLEIYIKTLDLAFIPTSGLRELIRLAREDKKSPAVYEYVAMGTFEIEGIGSYTISAYLIYEAFRNIADSTQHLLYRLIDKF